MSARVRGAAGAVERILLPRLNSIEGELKSINTRIDSVNARIDGELKSINGRIDSVNAKIDSSTGELRSEIKVVDTKLVEMDKRMEVKFDAASAQIESVRSEVRAQVESVRNEVRSLGEKVDLVKDMEKLKVEVAELKKAR